MPIQFTIAPLIPKTLTLREKLTPEEKFSRIKKEKESRGKAYKLRKFHFNVIETEKELFLFDGEGILQLTIENSLKGRRECRIVANKLFFSVPPHKQNGGFLITFQTNFEWLTEEELTLAKNSTL